MWMVPIKYRNYSSLQCQHIYTKNSILVFNIRHISAHRQCVNVKASHGLTALSNFKAACIHEHPLIIANPPDLEYHIHVNYTVGT